MYVTTTTVSELTTGHGSSEVSNQEPEESELTTSHGSNQATSKKLDKENADKQGASGCSQHYITLPAIAVSSVLVVLAHHIS